MRREKITVASSYGRTRTRHPLNKNFVKKKPQLVLVAQEEYYSDDEDDEEGGEIVPTATVAITIESPSSASLFNSPNENPHIIHKCFMAKTTSLTPHSKSFTPTNPYLM